MELRLLCLFLRRPIARSIISVAVLRLDLSRDRVRAQLPAVLGSHLISVEFPRYRERDVCALHGAICNFCLPRGTARTAKIPIICVHGLMDSHATWVPLINALRADPFIRANYQFWFYTYPSGFPYPHSAAIMRKQLDAIGAAYPGHKKAVLIGHSMGGIISRTMLTDSGLNLWNVYFDEPPAETSLSATTRKTLTDALIFRPRQDVSRAIFIAAPHRGSDLASNWLGRIGASLVKAPLTLRKISEEVREYLTLDVAAVRLNRIPNSIDTLSPENPFVKKINTLPFTPGIPYHSIIGDRGKGGNKDRTKPVSSDGVVPYWSSHLPGARSELVVPSNHSAQRHPESIAEVRRILELHVREAGRK